MSVETVRASATETELDRLNADLAIKLRDRVPLNARRAAPKPPAAAPPASTAPEPPSAALFDDGIDPSSQAGQFRDPYLRIITAHSEALSEGLEAAGVAISKLRKEVQELRVMVAELRGALAETTARSNETTAVVARLRTAAKGEKGDPGVMGPAGRDGAQGPRGEKGGRGQRGFETTGWLIDEAEYCITPLFYDNSQGPTLNLRGLFEQFHRDTEASEEASATDLEIEQTALRRGDLELQAERFRRGLPAK